ncbi:MAG: 50S ribosomal protein L35 [Kiritimatiellae bacterium]|nr:50S ribosomal protein L35 [Kiritimatiellia bacterium]
MATKVKMKTRKAVAKRFKKSATGKIMHKKPGRRHLAACKTRKQKRRLRQTAIATGTIARSLSIELGA